MTKGFENYCILDGDINELVLLIIKDDSFLVEWLWERLGGSGIENSGRNLAWKVRRKKMQIKKQFYIEFC